LLESWGDVFPAEIWIVVEKWWLEKVNMAFVKLTIPILTDGK
jgi:hypothetical protein